MLMKPPRCWRGRTDCEPLHSVEALPDFKSEAEWIDFETSGVEPESFVCAGCVADGERAIPQDAYRMCWKNDAVDETGEYDEQDLTHQMAVISQALAIIASRRVNGGTIDVITMQGEAA